jgi:aminopeptidase-like protein
MTPELPAPNGHQVGADMYRLISDLYPICRSITGNGFRETLEIIGKQIPLEVHEVPSGTQVFDWTVPQEWNIRDAYIKNSKGERVVDFRASNLHVVSYSGPVQARMSRAQLIEHLFSDPDHPDWIPYRTSYYNAAWGFCVSHRQLQDLLEGEYEVLIDSTLGPGHLTYGECFIKGKIPEEVLLSCHACHPSLCNDNLSGVALATFLARHLSSGQHRYSYRFLFIPGTIGSISWLALNEADVSRIRHGLVLTGVGDSGQVTYKKSRRGDAEVDRAAMHVLRHSGDEFGIEEFSPYGYDERQYCSPAFNLPVGCLMRTPHGRYPQYHSSADNLDFVKPAALADSFTKALAIISTLEGNARFLNVHGKGEPQLGRRGLYEAMGGGPEGKARQMALLWVLNQSDGSRSLLDIAEQSNIRFEAIREAADLLLQHGLLREIVEDTQSAV